MVLRIPLSVSFSVRGWGEVYGAWQSSHFQALSVKSYKLSVRVFSEKRLTYNLPLITLNADTTTELLYMMRNYYNEANSIFESTLAGYHRTA